MQIEANPSVWPLWLQAHQLAMNAIENDLAAAELPPLAWYDVLWTLEQAEDGRLRMADLAQRVLVTRSNLTRLVDRIEGAGLLRREHCAEDRRGFYAVLSEEGRQLRQRMWPVYRASLNRHVEGFVDERERAVLQAVFTRMRAALA